MDHWISSCNIPHFKIIYIKISYTLVSWVPCYPRVKIMDIKKSKYPPVTQSAYSDKDNIYCKLYRIYTRIQCTLYTTVYTVLVSYCKTVTVKRNMSLVTPSATSKDI